MAELPSQINWSSSLTAVRLSRTANTAQGDKILLPQSALEQLLAASTRTVPSTSQTFTSFDPFNPYSVAAARQERAQFQETSQQLPHPLMFRLTNQRNGNAVFAGIREFSANEGQVVLSPYLMEALGIEESQIEEQGAGPEVVDLTEDDGTTTESGLQITVKAHSLAKGTYVRLRPLEAGYNPDDWKSLLERQLRTNYTTLTKGSILTVQGAKAEEFRFLIDKFEPHGDGICVVDTDLEVDIEALNEEQARETLRRIAAATLRAGTEAGSSVGCAIDIWKAVEGRVLAGEYVDYELPSWDKSRWLEIELWVLQEGAEVDLFASPRSGRQRGSPRASEHVFREISSPNEGSRTIRIAPTNTELDGAESFLISVHGFSLPGDIADAAPRRFSLRARSVEASGSSSAPIEIASSPQRSSSEEQCTNCLQWVPKQAMVLHENFCRRNNLACPQCKKVFQKSSPEWAHHWHCPTHADAHGSTPSSKSKHDYYEHTSHTCPSCGPSSPFTFPSLGELARHRTTICPHKIILCRFCHLEVPQEGDPMDPASEAETALSGLTAHERVDGGRTTDCHLCGAIVRLRDMGAHTAHHELDKVSRPKPAVCRSALCGRTLHGIGPRGQVNGGTRMGQGPGNDLGLCSLCFGPLYVSMHDPGGKALRRRVERRYLAQLMTGCGKPWCVNERCKTGRAKTGLPALGSGAAAALPAVKPFLDAVDNHAEPVHFCVDETAQKRRKTAEMLAAEGVWELEWCIAALEAEGGDAARARTWLQDWAPARSEGLSGR